MVTLCVASGDARLGFGGHGCIAALGLTNYSMSCQANIEWIRIGYGGVHIHAKWAPSTKIQGGEPWVGLHGPIGGILGWSLVGMRT